MPRTPTVLLVDDEEHLLLSSESILRFAGLRQITTISDSRKVLPLLAQQEIGVVVLDLFMPYLSGRELLETLSQEYPHIPVIVMTAADEVDTAVTSMQLGAFDYLVKPVENSRLVSSIKRALEICSLKNQVNALKEHLLTSHIHKPEAFTSVITISPQMSAIFQYCEVIAPSLQPVVITGETGVGKELIARALHTLSGVPGKFIPVNIAGLDETLFTDTLFGHRKGAYTGADQHRSGLIGQATDGTLFLDEIGDLTEAVQVKLLRLLQEQEYYPVGSDTPYRSNARIIAATHRDLRAMALQKSFRNDLYYRLCSHQVYLPPLRERLEDVPLLLDHFLKEASALFNKARPTTSPALLNALSSYHFPGNIRELKALIYDAVARHHAGPLTLDDCKELQEADGLPHDRHALLFNQLNEWLLESGGGFPTIREMETLMIEVAMKLSKGNQGVAASLLGVSRQTLNKRLNAKKNEQD